MKRLQDLDASLMGELADDYEAPTLYTDEERRHGWIREGVREVSKRSPARATTTFVADSADRRRTAPTGAISIDRLFYRPASTVNDDEVEVPFAYEVNSGSIVMTDGIPHGYTVTIEYSANHTEPTETTETTLSDTGVEAAIAWAMFRASLWLKRRVVFKAKGVVEFTRGRYSQKSAALKQLSDDAKEARARFDDLLGSNDLAVLPGTPNPDRATGRGRSLTDVGIGPSGWDGSDATSGMTDHEPGAVER